MTQMMTWFTFSSIPAASMGYYGFSESELALVLNWGTIVYVAFAFLIVSFLSQAPPKRLRAAIRFGSFLILLGNIIRTIPTFFLNPPDNSSSSSSSEHYVSIGWRACVHVGQFINSIAGITALSPVSLLSQTYFPSNQYALATTIAYTSASLGMASLFFLGPAIASSSALIPRFLRILSTVSLVSF